MSSSSSELSWRDEAPFVAIFGEESWSEGGGWFIRDESMFERIVRDWDIMRGKNVDFEANYL